MKQYLTAFQNVTLFSVLGKICSNIMQAVKQTLYRPA